jgi:hypothetical protein
MRSEKAGSNHHDLDMKNGLNDVVIPDEFTAVDGTQMESIAE